MIGEIRTVLPPKGKGAMSVQGNDVPIEGKKLQITKELLVLHRAGFIRIVTEDIVNPKAIDNLEGVTGTITVPERIVNLEVPVKPPSSPNGDRSTSEAEGGSDGASAVPTSDPPNPLPQVQVLPVPEEASAHVDGVSSQTLESLDPNLKDSANSKLSTFSTRKEIEETLDWEALRDYVAEKTGYLFHRKKLEDLRNIALEKFDAERLNAK